MASAGFNLRSWASNSRRLQELATSENVLDSDEITKTLGMRWHTGSDKLMFADKSFLHTELATKREVLQQTSQIFDPLGILSPVTVRAKILMQEIWKRKIEWDTHLPTELQQIWRKLVSDLNLAINTEVDRYYFQGDVNDITEQQQQQHESTLHIFVDASIKSYGAAAYIVRGNQSAFVMAKNRVAPLKELTLPRLELMAALIGSRLANHLRKSLECTNIVLLSDSQIVLYWLRTTKPLQKSVQNRVNEILEITGSRTCTWKYCPTHDNQADLLTRGISAEQFNNSKVWKSDPAWLPFESEWPQWMQKETSTFTVAIREYLSDPQNSAETESAHVNDTENGCCLATIGNVITIEHFSSYKKLLRVTAYIQRFIDNCKKGRPRHQLRLQEKSAVLTVQEIQRAKTKWLRHSQQTAFSDEIADLLNQSRRRPLVRQLRLFLDDTGSVRCSGQIHNAPLDESVKFPLLIPAKHYLTRLIVHDAHVKQLHVGLNATVTYLRQKYWIPSIRQCVKTEINKCVVCKKVSGKPYRTPEAPPLVKYRVEDAPPFTVTGVDFTGALYCCFSCRTFFVALYPQDLKVETFIHAFRRFCSRKSLPALMVSDNATTYMAATTTYIVYSNHQDCRRNFQTGGHGHLFQRGPHGMVVGGSS